MSVWSAAVDGPPAAFQLDGQLYYIRPGAWVGASHHLHGFEDDLWPLVILQDVLTMPSLLRLLQRAYDPRDRLDMDDLWPVVTGVVGAVFGRPFYETGRLLAYLGDQRVDGVVLLRSGVDLLAMLHEHPSRVPGVIYTMLWEGAKDDTERNKLDFQLARPPGGAAARFVAEAGASSAWGAADEGSSFMAAMQAG